MGERKFVVRTERFVSSSHGGGLVLDATAHILLPMLLACWPSRQPPWRPARGPAHQRWFLSGCANVEECEVVLASNGPEASRCSPPGEEEGRFAITSGGSIARQQQARTHDRCERRVFNSLLLRHSNLRRYMEQRGCLCERTPSKRNGY